MKRVREVIEGYALVGRVVWASSLGLVAVP